MEELDAAFVALERELEALEKSSNDLIESNHVQASELAFDGRLALLNIRGIYRKLLRGAKAQQDKAQEAMKDADNAHRLLQGAQCEKDFIREQLSLMKKKIANRFEEDICLLPLERFHSEASEELLADIEDDHKLLIARMKFEEVKRKESLDLLREQLRRKTEQEANVARRKRSLDTMLAEAKALKQQTSPLWEKLSLDKQEDTLLVCQFPKPLYILHSRLAEYSKKHETELIVEAVTNPRSARTPTVRKYHSMENEQPSTPATKVQDQQIEVDMKETDALKTTHWPMHPTILLHILNHANGATLLSIEFEYHTDLDAVIANCQDSHGAEVLNSVLPTLESTEEKEEGTLEECRIYRWVQILANLDRPAGTEDFGTARFSTEEILQQLHHCASEICSKL